MASEKQIHLTGYIEVPAHRMEQITSALPEHIRLTRLEAGCVSFDVTPDPEHTGRFNVAEVFASRADFDAHQARTKTSFWAQVTDGIARQYSISQAG